MTPWTVARQAPPSMEFTRQEYWSGLPFPSPEALPHPRIEPLSPALAGNSLTESAFFPELKVQEILRSGIKGFFRSWKWKKGQLSFSFSLLWLSAISPAMLEKEMQGQEN